MVALRPARPAPLAMTTEPKTRAEPTDADLEARRAARRYPERPIVAVLAVVLRGEQEH